MIAVLSAVVYLIISHNNQNSILQEESLSAESLLLSNYYQELDDGQSKALSNVENGDYEAAQKLAAQSVSNAEQFGNKEVYTAKFYQAMILLNIDKKTEALTVFNEILNMDTDQYLKADVLSTMVDIYRELDDTDNERMYLDQLVAFYGDNTPSMYSERLKELNEQ
jgi:tetratricopeptide (TPR) repeat protein